MCRVVGSAHHNGEANVCFRIWGTKIMTEEKSNRNVVNGVLLVAALEIFLHHPSDKTPYLLAKYISMYLLYSVSRFVMISRP